MTIEPGTRLGPYQVTARIGAGGMGEVWRAHDARLERDLAIKILPAEMAADARFKSRFEREAKTISQLNHPNICSIYDVGEGYLAMELLEGETLRQRLESGQLAPRKAIEYGIQISNGLAAAHTRGITHRDLKPENIFLTASGTVKLLDFGLAKVSASGTDPDEATQARVTNPGTVMGTAGYMSPEQVRAEDVDHRTDIFALGAILYEMLSGRRAFRGRSSADTMSAILREDPPDLSGNGLAVPVALERVVRRCLEKNREERFQSAHDVAFALEAVSGTSSAIEVAPVATRSHWRRVAAALAAALAIAIVTAAVVSRLHEPRGVPRFTPVTFRNGRVTTASFAADGQTVIHSARWNGAPPDLFMTHVGESESRSLGLHNAQIASIAPTGEMALILEEDPSSFTSVRRGKSVLARMPSSGGVPRQLLEDVESADWSPDGGELAALVTRNGIQSLEYPLGQTLLAHTLANQLRVSPRGDLIAFHDRDTAQDTAGAVVVSDLRGKTRVLSSGWSDIHGIAWRPDGKEVWFTAARRGSVRALWGVDLDGHLRPLAAAPTSLSIMDVSHDGRALVNSDRRRSSMTVMEPGASTERDVSWLDYSAIADIAADGRSILFTEDAQGGGGYGAVYLWDLSKPEPVRLGEGRAVGLSGDGRSAIVFNDALPKQLTILPTGAGLPRHVNLPFTLRWATFLPDGVHALTSGMEGVTPQRIFLVDLRNGSSQALTPPNTWLCATSPDGSEFVVKEGSSGRALIYSLRGAAPRVVPGVQALTSRDFPLQWSADGRSLFVQASTDTEREVVIDLVDIRTGARRPWKRLVASDPASFYSFEPDIRITRDGSAYAYSCPRFLTDLYVVDGLR